MVLTTKKTKKVPPHEKRRHGHHHKQSSRYQNTYWPYLPLVFIVALGVLFNSMWPTLQSAVLGYATNTSINGLLLETNSQRAAHGVGKLALNAQLNAAAQAKANDMAARDYWSHNTPEGNAPWVFIANAGYPYDAAGENLAYGFGSSDTTVAGWMGSPSHRANLLNGAYKDAGFGMANAENYEGSGPQTIVVAMYGSRVETPAPAPEPEQKPAPAAPATTKPGAPSDKPAAEPAAKPEPKPASELAAKKPEAQAPASTTPKPVQPKTQQVSRLQLLSDNSAWVTFAVTIIASVAAAIFLFRHSIFWHRTIIKGERFVARHHYLDITLVAVAVAAVLLTRTAGIIQ